MNARRGGQGEVETRGAALVGAHDAPARPCRVEPRITLGDDPAIAAALGYAAADVSAHEQTEAYWRQVWSDNNNGPSGPEGRR